MNKEDFMSTNEVIVDGAVVRCIGCGAKVQTENKDEIGYTPQSALKNGLAKGEVYCQRCFRLRHYNEIVPVNLSDDDFLKLLSNISTTDALIVFVVDIFDVNGSMIPGLQRFVGDNQILLVGNKVDVLPSAIKQNKIKDWLRQRANANGIRPIDVELVSAKSNYGVDHLLLKVDKLRKGRSVFVVGVTNVGKSTLINQIIRQSSGIKDLITTSRFPGTTLDQIDIPLDDGQQIVDTPGIIQPQQMAHFLSGKELKLVNPQKRIKPRVYQLNPEQTLFFAGLGRLDYRDGRSKKGFTVYMENNLYIHRTKLENADDFYERHLGDLLTPPSEGSKNSIPSLVSQTFKVEEKSDIVIEGLGWITVPNGISVTAWAPKGVAVLIRPAMI